MGILKQMDEQNVKRPRTAEDVHHKALGNIDAVPYLLVPLVFKEQRQIDAAECHVRELTSIIQGLV